jgi:hypothetical protein
VGQGNIATEVAGQTVSGAEDGAPPQSHVTPQDSEQARNYGDEQSSPAASNEESISTKLDDHGVISQDSKVTASNGSISAELEAAINGLRNTSGVEADRYARKIAELSTHTAGNLDRVVVGKWEKDGGYVGEAKKNGGIWYETGPNFFSKLSEGLDELTIKEKAWNVNKQFLLMQLQRGVHRITLFGETIEAVKSFRARSYTALEIEFLDKNAGDYGYIRESNSWVKVK